MAPSDGTPASRIVLSYPADLSEWGRLQLRDRPFRAHLRRRHARAEPGDVWAEFLDVGCCGDSLDVPLRVERVEGGHAIDADTDVEYVEREACGLAGGWLVQSRAGPRGTADDQSER